MNSQDMPSPNYVIQDSEDKYDIVVNMMGAEESRLHAFLGSDQTKLYIIARSEIPEQTARYLLIFSLPADAVKDQITLDRRKHLFLIEVPKAAKETQFRSHLRSHAQLAEAI